MKWKKNKFILVVVNQYDLGFLRNNGLTVVIVVLFLRVQRGGSERENEQDMILRDQGKTVFLITSNG
jgi:hypothetical protein